MIVAELRRKPCFSAIFGNFHTLHASEPTESNALQLDGHPGGNLCTSIGRDEERSDGESRNRNQFYLAPLHFLRRGISPGRVRHAISGLHPEITVRRVENANP